MRRVIAQRRRSGAPKAWLGGGKLSCQGAASARQKQGRHGGSGLLELN